MANLSTLKSNLHLIQEAIVKLENGSITQEELESLVDHSKEVYERTIILRFKAYEEKVFGAKEGAHVTIPEVNEIEEEVLAIPDVLVEIEEEQISEELDEDQPAFDFSLFDDSTEEVKNEELVENATEHISVTSTISDDFGVHEEKISMEQVTLSPVADENKKFISKFSKIDPSFFNQVGMSKLDTLIGSFGLNERLQYINELFDGSSDAFSEAIKSLDNMSSIEDALLKMSTYANQFSWDNESETVEEFVIKIRRRYA